MTDRYGDIWIAIEGESASRIDVMKQYVDESDERLQWFRKEIGDN